MRVQGLKHSFAASRCVGADTRPSTKKQTRGTCLRRWIVVSGEGIRAALDELRLAVSRDRGEGVEVGRQWVLAA
eukprot:1523279-Prymnesium_polylepis.1